MEKILINYDVIYQLSDIDKKHTYDMIDSYITEQLRDKPNQDYIKYLYNNLVFNNYITDVRDKKIESILK